MTKETKADVEELAHSSDPHARVIAHMAQRQLDLSEQVRALGEMMMQVTGRQRRIMSKLGMETGSSGLYSRVDVKVEE